MNRNLLSLFFLLFFTAIFIRPDSARSEEPAKEPVRTVELTCETGETSVTVTLNNRGDRPVEYETLGYGEPKPEHINFILTDLRGQPMAPNFWCGTGLVQGKLKLEPGGTISKTYESCFLGVRNDTADMFSVALKTDVGTLGTPHQPLPKFAKREIRRSTPQGKGGREPEKIRNAPLSPSAHTPSLFSAPR